MSSLQPHFKILEISQLSPPPGSQAAQSSLPLTFYDIIWLYGGAVERIFFYPFPCSTTHFHSTILPNLKSSLCQALDIFYPLYGRIRKSAENNDKYELSYADGDSVTFVAAEMDGENFDDLSGNNERDAKRLLPLRPELHVESRDNSKQVLAIQITLFPNQGISIGIAVHHVACDGHTSTRFLTTWASICRQGSSSFSPLFDRTIVSDPKDIYSLYHKFFKALPPPPTAPTRPNGMVCRTFTLTAAQIQKLKEIAAAKAKDDNGSPLRFSTIAVTFAVVWVCLVRAKKYASDRKVYFLFVGNSSHGQEPPIPSEYFGNRIAGLLVNATAGELCKNEGFIIAAKSISKVIKEFKENPLKDQERFIDEMPSVISSQPLSVAGSPQLRVYDIDFGWGKPKKVELTSILESGAMSVTESRDEQGGVEVGFIIPKQAMDEFATQFSNGLKMLSLENES